MYNTHNIQYTHNVFDISCRHDCSWEDVLSCLQNCSTRKCGDFLGMASGPCWWKTDASGSDVPNLGTDKTVTHAVIEYTEKGEVKTDTADTSPYVFSGNPCYIF